MLDLNEVRMFVQVVRASSFAEAARRLGVPPNTLSRRIRQLESSLDTRLMQRSTRRLTLTPAGRLFYDRCAAAVDGVVEAGKALMDGSQHPSGSVRIAAPADFLDLFSVDWVAEFLTTHPLVRLDFVLSDARADLIAESIDVAFRGGSVRDASHSIPLVTAQFFKLVASPEYIGRRGMPKALADLADHDCLTVSGSPGPATWMLQGPRGEETVKVAGRFSGNSARVLKKACLSGLGVALLPTILVYPELRSGQLVQVLPEYRRDGADFTVVLPSQQQVPSAVSAFVEFATRRLRSMEISSQAAPRRSARRKR